MYCLIRYICDIYAHRPETNGSSTQILQRQSRQKISFPVGDTGHEAIRVVESHIEKLSQNLKATLHITRNSTVTAMTSGRVANKK